MKRIIFFLTLLFSASIHLQGQITPEHTYPGVSAAYINLPVSGYKYYVMDVVNSQCRLYNNDHSLWKTITLNIPANYTLYDIQYVTENLFNTDNSIELLYVSYIYNSTLAYYTYDTRIANENGTTLLSVPGAGYSYVYPAQTGSKLFLWVYNYSVSPSTVNTIIYSIPGQTSAYGIGDSPVAKQVLLLKAFPNPAINEVTIPYSLPATVNQAELKLFNMNGNIVKSFTVDHTFSNITVQTGDLAAGIYLYRIESASYKSETYKLSVRK
jgi:hypothetical protein